ncbi:leucine-rich repeat-containing protein 40-like [Anopheles nili]|uniref:leucine-rich repeat-containing protein 40-like n=1 Tax=Anopheles nili TaxID=185578 RepID=UPI00237A0C79|nr:leucine-rich repeat-containing protein 40-like [Anopheles nili]
MRPYRPRIVPLLFTLVNVWLWMYLLVEVAPQTCQKTVFQCTYSTLNLSSDGLQDLRASVELSPGMYSIEVNRLITKYTDGVLLQILSEFADTVEYQRYHERVLRIPPNVDLQAITVKQAPQLQVITVVAPNTKLTLLELHNTGLSTLPASLHNLRGLYILKISECNLEYFSLDPLANSPNISIVTIDDNNINKLVTSNNSQLFIPITTLSLSNNQLQFVDEDFFKPLRNLEFLVLTRNKIKRFGGRPFILSNLMVFNLIQNQLLSLNVTQWKMPALVEFCLDYNNLTRVPAGLVGFPKLEILRLRGNRLTSIDLRLLEGFKARLRASARLLENVFVIEVEQLITPYVDGVLLQLLSEFANEVIYEQYYERVLRIPPNGDLQEITLNNAPELQVLTVVAPNFQLKSLELHRTRLEMFPEALLNLRRLAHLIMVEGVLENFSLDLLANSPNISTVVISTNKINQLITSNNSVLFIPIVDLSLADNQLQFVDGDFFKPLRNLDYLNLENNKIQRIGGRTFILPNVRYINLMHNELLTLNVTRWKTPKLLEIVLDYNNLTRIPVGLERLPKLSNLLISNNRLTSVDLRRFDGCGGLLKIDLSNNLLQNVLVSQAGRVSLPNLTIFNLPNNKLNRLEVAKWDFPLLDSLVIAFNQLQRLPNLFQYLPKLRRVTAFKNPLLCSTVRQWQQYVSDYKLQIDTTAYGMPCETNSTFTLPSGRVLCCVE